MNVSYENTNDKDSDYMKVKFVIKDESENEKRRGKEWLQTDDKFRRPKGI